MRKKAGKRGRVPLIEGFSLIEGTAKQVIYAGSG